MAHKLYEKDGEAQFFTAQGKPAWHGLGKVLDNHLTGEEAIKAAGLDFHVEKRKMYLEDGTEVPDRFALVRTDENRVLHTVSKTYEIVQNKDAFLFFDNFIDESDAVFETGGVIDEGKKTWLMAKLPEWVSVGDEKIVQYATFMNSFDTSLPVHCFVNNIAIVCNNTLTAALRNSPNSVSIQHRGNMEVKIKEAHRLLGIVNHYRQEIQDSFNRMVDYKIDPGITKMLVEELIPYNPEATNHSRTDNMRKSLMTSIESGEGQELDCRKENVWGFYNGVTHWLDHDKSYGDDNARLKSIWLGRSANIRQKAFDLCMHFAG